MLFTNRKIFRPGQTVYWKAIGSIKDTGNVSPRLLPEGTRIKFYLRDAQQIIIDSTEKVLNSFGSCHGIFILPQDRLTGSFSIVPAGYSHTTADIRVEEYKRPRFAVEWEKKKERYSLQDSIKISGSTRTYAGNILQQAKVKYNIKRMDIRSWQTSNEYESWTTITNQEGKFHIQFSPMKARENKDVENMSFVFTISVEITDASGESQTSTNFLYAGKQSISINWNLRETMNETDWKSVRLFTNDLGNEKVSVPVHISIYSLATPGKFLRKRYWEVPDQPILGEQQFKQLFPDDAYGHELDPAHWQRLQVIAEDSIVTD
ncbi:MAG: MG2 domain-containing protein, partial [bacterium]